MPDYNDNYLEHVGCTQEESHDITPTGSAP